VSKTANKNKQANIMVKKILTIKTTVFAKPPNTDPVPLSVLGFVFLKLLFGLKK